MISEGAGSLCIYSVLLNIMRKSIILVAKWPKICLANHRGTVNLHSHHTIKITFLEHFIFMSAPHNQKSHLSINKRNHLPLISRKYLAFISILP